MRTRRYRYLGAWINRSSQSVTESESKTRSTINSPCMPGNWRPAFQFRTFGEGPKSTTRSPSNGAMSVGHASFQIQFAPEAASPRNLGRVTGYPNPEGRCTVCADLVFQMPICRHADRGIWSISRTSLGERRRIVMLRLCR